MNKNLECRSCCRKNEKHWAFGKTTSEETKKKLSNALKGKNVWMNGKILSQKTKQKMREIKLNTIKEMGGFPSFNKNACNFIDKLNKERGWKLQHALNGGEIQICGYSVDGYDKEKNIIFEYDEIQHRYPKRNKKDIYRQDEIINNIHPKMFIRYDETTKKLYDIITNNYIKA
jgi:hypothetical protein